MILSYSDNDNFQYEYSIKNFFFRPIRTWFDQFASGLKGLAFFKTSTIWNGLPYLVKNLRQSRRLENVNRSKRVNLCTT